MQISKDTIEQIKAFKTVEVGPLAEMPEKVLQFGEGNFLRAFVDWIFNALNARANFNGKVVIVQPLAEGLVDLLNQQDGLFTVLLRGIENGQVVKKAEIVTAVSRGLNPYSNWNEFLQCAHNPDLRFVLSNTTEAGIAYVKTQQPEGVCPAPFPPKLAALLYERFKAFDGAADKGLVIIPCELIDRNGDRLKECILQHASDWQLDPEFSRWLERHNHFLNTLVDRIVPGYPRDEIADITKELGYKDKLVDTGEIFHLWVIEGDERFAEELPFHRAGLNVIWTDNLKRYRDRKVRILNGAHTMTVPAAFLAGINTVKESVEDDLIGRYMRNGIFEEILPTLELSQTEKEEFAEAVLERFQNPFIKHRLLDISLNSVSKFKVRVLPSLLAFTSANKRLPEILSFSLAALMVFYRGREFDGKQMFGVRGEEKYVIRDDESYLNFFFDLWQAFEQNKDFATLTRQVLKNDEFWGRDLNEIPGLSAVVCRHVETILAKGMAGALNDLL